MSDQTHDHVISSLSLSSIFSCQFQCETGADASYLFSRIESKKYQFPFIFPPSSFPLSRHVPSNAAALNQHCREGKNHSQLDVGKKVVSVCYSRFLPPSSVVSGAHRLNQIFSFSYSCYVQQNIDIHFFLMRFQVYNFCKRIQTFIPLSLFPLNLCSVMKFVTMIKRRMRRKKP